MALSPKQAVYQEMLWWTLPYLRDVATWRWWQHLRDRSEYYETELIHNLPFSIFDPDFTDRDIQFLNRQAKAYCRECSGEKSPLYPDQVERIRRLFALVPEDLRPQLDWPGPQGLPRIQAARGARQAARRVIVARLPGKGLRHRTRDTELDI